PGVRAGWGALRDRGKHHRLRRPGPHLVQPERAPALLGAPAHRPQEAPPAGGRAHRAADAGRGGRRSDLERHPLRPPPRNAPVTLYGEGLRNAYDLVWHSNGHLYAPTNGTAAGGNTPGSPPGVTPVVPPLISIPTQDDFLFDVVPGGYYGHPNPARGQYV